MRARLVNKTVNISKIVLLLGVLCKRTQGIPEELGTSSWL